MSDSQTRRSDTGKPGNSGLYDGHHRPEDDITLTQDERSTTAAIIPEIKTPDGRTLPLPVLSPFAKQEQVIIPAGTSYRYRGETVTSKRKRTITVFGSHDGYLGRGRSGMATKAPLISWAGSGGYWVDCPVTGELAAANQKTFTVNASNLKAWRYDILFEEFDMPELPDL